MDVMRRTNQYQAPIPVDSFMPVFCSTAKEQVAEGFADPEISRPRCVVLDPHTQTLPSLALSSQDYLLPVNRCLLHQPLYPMNEINPASPTEVQDPSLASETETSGGSNPDEGIDRGKTCPMTQKQIHVTRDH